MGKRKPKSNPFIEGLTSLHELFDSVEYGFATKEERLELLLLSQLHLVKVIQGDEDQKKMINECSLEIIRLVGQETLEKIENELLEIEDTYSKILLLEKKIAEINHSEALTDMEYGYLFVENAHLRQYKPILKVLESKLELLKKEHNQIKGSQDTDKIELESFNTTPINIDAQEKFIYCYELGIIEYLREFLKNKNQKITDSKIYSLLSLITGVNASTIKRLMPFANNPNNANEGNPFTNEKLMERVNKFLYDNGLKG